MTSVDLDKIKIDGRMRRDMGDLESLAASIRESGVLSPVLLTPDLVLVCGERRVRAARLAGLTRIPAHISGRFEDAAAALTAERDENTCRKEMAPSELLALGEQLEKLERPKADARKAEGRRRGGEVFAGREASASMDAQAPVRVDVTVADALGISAVQYGRIKTVAKAAEVDPNPEVREIAAEAINAMDAGELTVSAAATKVREARKKEDPMTATTDPSRLAIPQPPRFGPRRKHSQVIDRAVIAGTGMCMALDEIAALDGSINKEEADRYAADLSRVIRSLKRIQSLLKEV